MPPPGATGKQSSSSASQSRAASSSQAAASPSKSAPLSSSNPTGVAEKSGHKQSSSSNANVAGSSSSEKHVAEKDGKGAQDEEQVGPVKRVWHKVKEEVQHYWHGTKLLGKEMKISGRLLRRLLLGYSLTRREHRQLKRTMADLLRLIPFAPFIIIPFGELLLPVAIKIFPNMLPSTFESKFAVEEKRRGLIKVRLQMAKFLQGTIREGGIQATDKVKTSDEFKEFFRKVRATGEQPSSEDVIKVGQLFDDDLTLDNLTRPQLVSMCRYMQINAFGTDNYLRYQIRTKLNRIRRDDIVIQHEGLDKLSLLELQSACGSRGIQTLNLDEDRLREDLRQWIDLHITQRISGTLLILSKAFNYMPTGEEGAASQLKSLELTLSSLPDNLISEAELNVNKDHATNKQRLEVLQQQEELIEDEAEQEAAEEEARKVEKKRKEAERARLAKEEDDAKALLPRSETEVASSKSDEEKKKKESDEESDELKMTKEQLTELGEALSLLSAKSSVLKEREELAQLIKEVSGVPEEAPATVSAETAHKAAESERDMAQEGKSEEADLESATAKERAAAAKEATAATTQSAGSRSLAKRVKSMLETIDEQLEAYEKEVGSKMHIIEASASGKISVDDLEQALRLIKHSPPAEVLERLVDSMDKDKDGLIPLQEVVALAEQEIGLGIVREDSIKDIAGSGRKLGDEARAGQKGGEEDQEQSRAEEASPTPPSSCSTKSSGTEEAQGEAKDSKGSNKQLRREDIVKD